MEAWRALDLLEHLGASGLEAWLDGGWAVDALLGEQTREHDDLDLLTRLEDSGQIEKVLGERGYLLGAGGPPHSFEMVDGEGHQVDVHPVSFTPNGDGLYTMLDGREWIYPAHGFDGSGRILGHEIPCLTPEVVIVNHATGYALDEAHQRDVLSLAARYGLPVPDFRTA
jgi:lincosamide nucleotidyltransferase A/C/D/E